jgi:transcriptional regulator with XRE-family HTH domain
MITKEQIKAARALLNWNQQKLAEATSISKTAIANIERGQASPRIASLKSIKKLLKMEVLNL